MEELAATLPRKIAVVELLRKVLFQACLMKILWQSGKNTLYTSYSQVSFTSSTRF
jgi:hypothetical protein